MNLTESTCCNNPETATNPDEARSIRPAVSSRNDETGVHLDIALPGVRKEDLKLTVHDGLLSLDASRRDAPSAVRYAVSLKLAERLDAARISAALEDGVLKAVIPLRDEAKPREIAIS